MSALYTKVLDLEKTHLVQTLLIMVKKVREAKRLFKGHMANNSCDSKFRALYMTPLSQDLCLTPPRKINVLFL